MKAIVAGLATLVLPEGGGDGRSFAFTAGGSVEGGFEELVEFRLSYRFNSAVRYAGAAMTARMAAWASGGPAFQSDLRIEGREPR
jgi:hypothetical protein